MKSYRQVLSHGNLSVAEDRRRSSKIVEVSSKIVEDRQSFVEVRRSFVETSSHLLPSPFFLLPSSLPFPSLPFLPSFLPPARRDTIRHNITTPERSSKIFLKKWGISSELFIKFYLKSNTFYNGPLNDKPKVNIIYLIELVMCKIKLFLLKVFNLQ